MRLELWPKAHEHGSYYNVWLKMAVAYIVVTELCEGEEWYGDLEFFAKVNSTDVDGVRDMLAFIEIFYHGLAYCDFGVYLIVRDCLYLF